MSGQVQARQASLRKSALPLQESLNAAAQVMPRQATLALTEGSLRTRLTGRDPEPQKPSSAASPGVPAQQKALHPALLSWLGSEAAEVAAP
eukprot:3567823-Amphidinium_carterae.1